MKPQWLLDTADLTWDALRQSLYAATGRFVGLCAVLIIAGCVTSIKGGSGPIAWEATDFRVLERSSSGVTRQFYAFTLVLQETQGSAITLTRMEQNVSQRGRNTAGSTTQSPIDWKVRARGELRQPFSFYWYCVSAECQGWESIAPSIAPRYNLVLTGTDDRGQAVRVVMDFNLPANPPRPKIGPAEELPTTSLPGLASVPVPRDSGSVPFQTVGKLILVHATLNHKEHATLLLDTGAGVTLVTPATAKRLGISPKAEAPKRTITVLGGRKVEVPMVELTALAVGETMANNLRVGVLESFPHAPLMDGILGGDFLRHFTLTLDYATSRLQLIAKATLETPSSPDDAMRVTVRSVVPIQLVGNHVLVPVMLNHQESATLLLDTGATYTRLTPKTAQRLGISPTATTRRRTTQVADGQTQDSPVVPLAALAVGAALVEQLQVNVSDVFPQSHAVDGLLGGDFLENFVLTLDRTAGRLLLETRPVARP